MIQLLIQRAVRRYVGGPSQSWIVTAIALSLHRLVKSKSGRQELVDLSTIKPGEKIVIEALSVSHKRQIKQIKQSKRAEKRAAKAARKA